MYRFSVHHFRRMSDNSKRKSFPYSFMCSANVTFLSLIIVSVSFVPGTLTLHSSDSNLTGTKYSSAPCSELEKLFNLLSEGSIWSGTEFGVLNESERSQVSQLGLLQEDPVYQKKIAYAQKLAFCFTLDHGEIPVVEGRSQLIKNAECRPNSTCQECLLMVTTCEKNDWKLRREDTGEEKSSLELELQAKSHHSHENQIKYSASEIQNKSPKLVFHCYRPSSAGTGTFDAYFKMEYESLIALDQITKENANLVPRIFVVERIGAQSHHSRPIAVTTSWLFPYDGVKRSHHYSIRVTPVSPKIIFKRLELPSMIFLGKEERGKDKPTNVSVHYDHGSIGSNSTNLLIRWKSGSKTNASCNSKVYFLDDDDDEYRPNEQKEPQEAFWTTISKQLNFGKNYKIQINEQFDESESSMEVFIVQVPTCFEVYNYSFKRCPPPRVENLTIKSESVRSLYFSWDPPHHTTEVNAISHYNVNISRPEILSPRNSPGTGGPIPALHSLHTSVYTAKVQRNEAYWSFQTKNGTIKGRITVSIQAFSDGGKSEVATATFDLPTLAKDDGLLDKIWVAAVVIACVILTIIFFFWLKNYREKLQRKKQLHEYFEKLDKESIQGDPTVDRYSSKWDISSGALVLGDVIGEGAFGLVRKALLYKDGQKLTVAVKTLRAVDIVDGVDEKDSGKFWEEFNILKGLDPHMHVVGLVGICKSQFPALVVEYCHGGDLQTHLRKASQIRANQQGGRFSHSRSTSANNSSSSTLNNEVKVRMSMVTNEAYFLNKFEPGEVVTELDLLSYSRQISCGMEFLSTNKIVHRDLAARNVLIGPNRTLKIADFGLSRDVYEQNWYKKNSNGKIPIKWLAIECLLQEVYTTKSDVWSYGILLWEIVTFGGNPYPGVENTRIFDLLKSGYRMPQPENCSDDLYTLMCQCWQEKPIDRPDFASVKHKIDNIIEKSNLVVYMNLEHDPESESSSVVSHAIE